SAQAMARLVGMPLTALATMSGWTQLTWISWTGALGLAGQPRGCANSASLGSIANFGFFAQIGWSAKCRSGGWLKALEATIQASKFSFWKRNLMKSLASGTFFENFQMPIAVIGGAEWVPAGPAGLLWWLISSAI